MSVTLAMIGSEWVIGDLHNGDLNDSFAFKTLADFDKNGNPIMSEQIQPLLPFGFWNIQPRMKINFKEEELRIVKTVEQISITQPEYADWLKKYYNSVVGNIVII